MANYGFVRVAAFVPKVYVGDPMRNAEEIQKTFEVCDHGAIQIAVFPELCLTGYTCRDLFTQEYLLKRAHEAFRELFHSMPYHCMFVFGMPLAVDGMLFNVAVVCANRSVCAVIPKRFIPNEHEFEERRWFRDGDALRSDRIVLAGQRPPIGNDILLECIAADGTPRFRVGIEICEDLWVASPPSTQYAQAGATILCNLSASPVTVGKADYRRTLIASQSGRCIAGYVYASAGVHESSADVTFDGHSLIAENGQILDETRRFARDAQMIVRDIDVAALDRERRITGSFGQAAGLVRQPYRIVALAVTGLRVENGLERTVDSHPFVPSVGPKRDERCEEVFSIQCAGLARRLEAVSAAHHDGEPFDLHLGLSGGLDSTHAALVCAGTLEALGWPREHLVLRTMPGFGTTQRTRTNAHRLAVTLDLSLSDESIVATAEALLRAAGHEPCYDCLMCENAQARVRQGMLLTRGFTIGTGDLSEAALGWCTYGGDHLSNYHVNAGVPKTLIQHLIRWVAEQRIVGGECADVLSDVLLDILATPISPELRAPAADGAIAQKTEDILGPYELHDFFLYHVVRHGAPPEKILFLAERAFEGVYDRATILTTLRTFGQRFFDSQFKRDAMPNGPKVGSVALSPRGDWRMPSDASPGPWLRDLEDITQDDR